MRIAFALLAVVVILGALLPEEQPPEFDARISKAVQTRVDGGVGIALRVTSTALYPPWNLLASAALALGVLLVRGRSCALLALICTVGGLGVSYGLKRVYLRHRPPPTIADGGSVSSVTSYPSGHVTWTAAALGSLWVCFARGRRRAVRWTSFFLVVLLTAWVALSRIYLGRHYFTDTLGGALLGAALVMLVARWLLRPCPFATADATLH